MAHYISSISLLWVEHLTVDVHIYSSMCACVCGVCDVVFVVCVCVCVMCGYVVWCGVVCVCVWGGGERFCLNTVYLAQNPEEKT